MARIFYGVLLVWIAGLFLLPGIAYAGVSDSVEITCTRNSSIDGITNFVVSVTDQSGEVDEFLWFDDEGTWDNPAVFDYIVIRKAFDEYPTSATDGHYVYQGTGETFTETITGVIEEVYYVAWAYSNGTYSAPAYYHLEVESLMISSMYLIGLILLAGLAALFAFKTTAILIRVGAASFWLTVLLYILSDDRSLDVSNPWVVALGLSLVSMVIGILLLYAGMVVDKGFIAKKPKETRSRGQVVRDNYKARLRSANRR